MPQRPAGSLQFAAQFSVQLQQAFDRDAALGKTIGRHLQTADRFCEFVRVFTVLVRGDCELVLNHVCEGFGRAGELGNCLGRFGGQRGHLFNRRDHLRVQAVQSLEQPFGLAAELRYGRQEAFVRGQDLLLQRTVQRLECVRVGVDRLLEIATADLQLQRALVDPADRLGYALDRSLVRLRRFDKLFLDRIAECRYRDVHSQHGSLAHGNQRSDRFDRGLGRIG